MKKNVTAVALAVASIMSQDSFAAQAASTQPVGTQVQIGCTLPAATGATVYSIDNTVAITGGTDTITLPAGVSAGASCSLALNAMSGATGIGSTSTAGSAGKWVATGVSTGTPVGVSPAGLTQSNSGYALQAFTFVIQ